MEMNSQNNSGIDHDIDEAVITEIDSGITCPDKESCGAMSDFATSNKPDETISGKMLIQAGWLF
jgi:hypothetical protein